MKKNNKGKFTHNYFNSSKLLMLLSALIIGYFSPSNLFKTILTFGVFYILSNFHSIIHPATTFIFNFINNAGNTKLKNLKMINSNTISTLLVLILFIQCFFVNYLFHRYTGILILDPYAIYFWISSYGINIILNTIFSTKKYNFELKTPTIITSAINAILLIKLIKTYPDIIHIPEQYATMGENMILRLFYSENLPTRYPTKI